MVFSKREKLILWLTIAALAALVLDRYALTPLLDARAALAARKAGLTAKKIEADNLIARRDRLAGTWENMLADGMKDNASEAESQALRALRDWSALARLRLTELRPERSSGKEALPQITIHFTGLGSMEDVRQMLCRIKTAAIPMKITMLQLGSRRGGTDDLSLQLKVSTLYTPPGPVSPDEAAGRRTPAGENR